MSNVCAIYHIVFCTKKRARTLPLEHIAHVHRFIYSILKENQCTMYAIGGIENHVHILINLNPTVSLSHLLMEIKAKSSSFASVHGSFPLFEGWGKGYYAATLAYKDKDKAVEYIRNQVQHHYTHEFDDELERLLEVCGMVAFKDDYR